MLPRWKSLFLAFSSPVYMKHESQRSLAVALTDTLFDIKTRQKSNVRDKGKDQLDPTKIKNVKAKCFEVHQVLET